MACAEVGPAGDHANESLQPILTEEHGTRRRGGDRTNSAVEANAGSDDYTRSCMLWAVVQRLN
jgi:hypothetical protein